MNVLGLGTYDSDEESERPDEKIEENVVIVSEVKAQFEAKELYVPVQQIESISNAIIMTENLLIEPTIAITVVRKNTYSRVNELPPSPTAPANPKSIRKINEYLELKEISGFNLTEVTGILCNNHFHYFQYHCLNNCGLFVVDLIYDNVRIV